MGESEGDKNWSVVADDPISLPEEDVLDRNRFAKGVIDLAEHVSTQTKSCVLGLIGPWGSGKSSVLRLIEEQKPKAWKTVQFNPWEYADLERQVRGFFAALAGVLPTDRSGKKTRKAIARYANAAAPLGRIVNVPGVDLSQALKVAGDLLGSEPPLRDLHRDVDRQLAKERSPIVVVVDDVDRLHPDELITLFKLVRLLGQLPNLYYLLAFDEETVLSLLSQTAVAKDDPNRGLDYLEKIVQIRIDIPPLHEAQARRMLNESLEALVSAYGIDIKEDDAYRLATTYDKHLSRYLDTPRNLRRFIAQVQAYWPLVRNETNFVDFLLLTFLRTRFPAVYSELQRSKAELTRSLESLFSGRRSKNDPERYLRVLVERTARSPETDSVLGVILAVFGAEGTGGGATLDGSSQEALAAAQRAVHESYFDRYFYFGVPPGDIPDFVPGQFLEEIRSQLHGPATQRLKESASSSGHLVIEKLGGLQSQLQPREGYALLGFLIGLSETLEGKATLLGSPRDRAIRMASQLMTTCEVDEVNPLNLQSHGATVFAFRALDRAIDDLRSVNAPAPVSLGLLQQQIVARIKELLAEARKRPVSEVEEFLRITLFGLPRIEGVDWMKEWLAETLDSSRWTTADFAALFMSVYSVGDSRSRHLFEFDLNQFCFWMSPKEAVDRMGIEPAEFSMATAPALDDDVSFDNRVRRAKTALVEAALSKNRAGNET